MKKKITMFIVMILLLALMSGTGEFIILATEIGTVQYTGTLKVPKNIYNLKLGEYVLDGSNVWTVQEADKVTAREGLICTWEHDGKTEGLADYSSGSYPEYKHYCENENIFAPCYVVIYDQNENMYSSYDEFKKEITRIYAIPGAAAKVETYNAFYAKNVGNTNFIYKNGNLSISIAVNVTDPSATNNAGNQGAAPIENETQETGQDIGQDIGKDLGPATGNDQNWGAGSEYTNEQIGSQTENHTGSSINDQTQKTGENMMENQPVNQPSNQLANQAANQPANQPIDKQADQTTNKAVNQSELQNDSQVVSQLNKQTGTYLDRQEMSENDKEQNGKKYSIFVLSAITIILIVVGIICFVRKKR